MRLAGFLLAGLGAGLFGWHVGRVHPDEPAVARLTASPLCVFVDGSKSGETGQVTFTLSNRGTAAAKVTRVEPSCYCLKLETAIPAELVLEPGCTFQLSARIRIPESGIEKGILYVVHDGEASPLQLTVEASSRQSLPYLLNKSRMQVAFFALNTPSATEKLRLTTCEPSDGKAWLGQVSCDLPEVTVEPTAIKEDRVGTCVVRVYEFRIGWKRLPSTPEFGGKLRVATNYGSRSEIEIGLVSGTLATRDKVSLEGD